MTTSSTAYSTASNFSIKINGNYTCDTANVVYLLECNLGKLQYVGESKTSFRLRFNNHKAHVSALPHLPLSKHANVTGHTFNNIKVTILESGFRTHYDRGVRESFLIFKFNTVAHGLNESAGKLSCLHQ